MSLLIGTVLLRPYVVLFLLSYLVVAGRDLGLRRTAVFTVWVWLVAFIAELASTRIGIPFGLYHYTGDTRGSELFLSNVPFFDPLSFPFLAYAALCLARLVLGTTRSQSGRAVVKLALLSGVLMMLLDVVIDPIAVRGDRWFLGRVFWYPEGGIYFGVPLSNFVGWFVVGAIGVGGGLLAPGCPMVDDGCRNGHNPKGGVALYYAVLVFNLAVTAWIGEWLLLASGLTLHLILGIVLMMTLRCASAGLVGAIPGGGSGRGA